MGKVKEKEGPKKDRIFCNTCMQVTHHSVEGEYQSFGEVGDGDITWGGKHSLLKCCGCETPTLKNVAWCSEDHGERGYDFEPPRKSDKERIPKQFDSIRYGSPLESAYRQTVSAFNQKLYTLSGAGVRLVIEGVCKDRKIEEGTLLDKTGSPRISKKTGLPIVSDSLEGKIYGLAEKRYILSEQAKILHEIRFLGNDAAHELDQPSESTVATALDIVEHLLEQVYEQPEKGKTLAARVRPKKRKPRKKRAAKVKPSAPPLAVPSTSPTPP